MKTPVSAGSHEGSDEAYGRGAGRGAEWPPRVEEKASEVERGGKSKLRNRLRRIEGQVRGVQRMVREDAPCVDILTQIGSITAATEKVALLVLTDHAGRRIRECVEGEMETEVTVGEISRAVECFLRV